MPLDLQAIASAYPLEYEEADRELVTEWVPTRTAKSPRRA